MIALRSLAFGLGFWVWTALLAFVAVTWVVTLCRRHAIFSLARFWSRGVFGMLKLFCGIDHRLLGLERLPEGPCIIAAKHQSAWDTMIFLCIFDAPCYVLKQELLRIPLFGRAVRHSDMIAVDRSGGPRALKGVVEQAGHIVAQGRSIVIFPEGTRTAPGDRKRYQPGVAALYLNLDVPVIPVALNSGLFWGRNSFLKKPGRILLEVLPPLPAGLPRKEFLARLEEEVEDHSDRLMQIAQQPGQSCG